MTLKARLTEDMKTAMRAKDSATLSTIRLVNAAIKQFEVDERAEAERELQLAQEYQDVVSMFRYAVETDRRFYLANNVDVKVVSEGPRPIVEVTLTDAWVWDMYRKSRFVPKVRVLSFKDVNVEDLPGLDI